MEQPIPDTGSELGSELRILVGGLHRRFRSQRPVGELGEMAVGVLIRLQKVGPQTLTELAEVAGVTTASLGQSIARLDELGYIARTRDAADRRRTLIAPTASGIAIAIEVRARMSAWFEAQLAALTAEERGALEDVLPILRKLSGG